MTGDELDRHVALVDEFMRGWGYAPSPSDAEEFLVDPSRIDRPAGRERGGRGGNDGDKSFVAVFRGGRAIEGEEQEA